MNNLYQIQEQVKEKVASLHQEAEANNAIGYPLRKRVARWLNNLAQRLDSEPFVKWEEKAYGSA